jgi:hypothetical protein
MKRSTVVFLAWNCRPGPALTLIRTPIFRLPPAVMNPEFEI